MELFLYLCFCACMLSRFSHVWLFVTLWTVARPPPLSLGSLVKNPGVGCRALFQAIFPTQGSNPRISCLPGLAGRFFTSRATWESLPVSGASPGAQLVTNLPAVQEIEETQLQSLGREAPLQKEMATHPCILALRIPWTEEPRWLQSMGSQTVRHSWVS